jgi:hypothetical protein
MCDEHWSTLERDVRCVPEIVKPHAEGCIGPCRSLLRGKQTGEGVEQHTVSSTHHHHHHNAWRSKHKKRTPIPHLPLYKAVYGRPAARPYALKACAIVCVPTGNPATKPMSSSNEEITCETLPVSLKNTHAVDCTSTIDAHEKLVANDRKRTQDRLYVPLYTLVRPVSIAALDGPHLFREQDRKVTKSNKERE